jgi:hypothetical protein
MIWGVPHGQETERLQLPVVCGRVGAPARLCRLGFGLGIGSSVVACPVSFTGLIETLVRSLADYHSQVITGFLLHTLIGPMHSAPVSFVANTQMLTNRRLADI